MKTWSKLPNAKYIDQVLADLKSHPEEFNVAYTAVRGAAYDAAYDAARGAAYDAARAAVRGAVAALIAWDHASKYLAMSYKELQVWYQLNEDPAALLLLPYVKARELIAEKVMA